MYTYEQEPMPRHVVILGAGGGAKLAYWHLQAAYPGTLAVCAADDMPGVAAIETGGVSLPVVSDWRFERHREAAGSPAAYTLFVAAIGLPRVRKVMVEKALSAGLAPAPTLFHPRACVVGPLASLGRGGLMSPFSLVTQDCAIGNYVHMAPHSLVGHDARLDDHVSLNPGAQVAGSCHLMEGVMVGMGAVIREGVRVAPGVFIGAHACLLNDVDEPGAVMIGIPARRHAG